MQLLYSIDSYFIDKDLQDKKHEMFFGRDKLPKIIV